MPPFFQKELAFFFRIIIIYEIWHFWKERRP
jgi:hypothetical protein